jgi:DNA polymerase III alpha subunit
MREQYLPELKQYIPLDVDQQTFDGVCQSEWFMPDEYKDLNVYKYVLGKAETPCEQPVQDRIWEEIKAYEERDMLNLLRYMIYLVDFMRENNIVWGVGRGSSVASYVLYLIGVHKIDSIQYGLDWQEFLR